VSNLFSHIKGITYGKFSGQGAEEYLDLRKKITIGLWRELHNEELRDIHSSPNIIRTFKSKNVRWGSM
jgi:hypothetical protein